MLELIAMLVASFYSMQGVKKVAEKTIQTTTSGEKLSVEVDTVARTIWGEARGEGPAGMQAVANVIANRVKKGGWWGKTFVDVCKKAYQFSCWNKNDPNSTLCQRITITDPQFVEAVKYAKLATEKRLMDITGGATHYHTKQVMPAWARGQENKITARVGNHIFYKGIA